MLSYAATMQGGFGVELQIHAYMYCCGASSRIIYSPFEAAAANMHRIIEVWCTRASAQRERREGSGDEAATKNCASHQEVPWLYAYLTKKSHQEVH